MKFFLLFLTIFLNSFAVSSIDEIMEEIATENSEKEIKECKYKNNASFLIVNKIEGRSETIELSLNKKIKYENLEITLTKCCATNMQNYGFFTIYDNKTKKEIFKGWQFSQTSSANSLEDIKFDTTLLKCY